MAKSTSESFIRSKYDVRMDALDLAVRTNNDNRSIDADGMVSAALIYEKFLTKANDGN
jgi:hypothetical protein